MPVQKKNCDVLKIKNKKLIETYNEIADKYYELRENMVLYEEMDFFNKLINGRNILDAGCGNGRDAVIFSEKGFSVIAIDNTENQLEIARKRTNSGKIEFLKMDILDLKLSKEYFDGIWCCAVLSHFYYQEFSSILKSFYNILKENGILFFTVKKGIGECYIKENEFAGIERFTSFFEEHIINDLLSENGFKIIKSYVYNEQKKFTSKNRDIDFIVVFCMKDL